MSRLASRTKHVSYANLVSSLCLILLLGAGGAHAAGLANDSVKSKHIKNGQVRTSDLDADAVGSQAVAQDSLSGVDIKESTLAGVNAGKVGGLEVKKIFWRVPLGTGSQSVLTFPGKFRIDAQCKAGGDVQDVAAFTAEDGSQIAALANYNVGTTDADSLLDIASKADSNFDSNEGFAVDNVLPGADEEHVVLDFVAPSGFVAHVDLVLAWFGNGCLLTGIAIGG